MNGDDDDQWRNKFTLGPGAEHKNGPPQVSEAIRPVFIGVIAHDNIVF